jgi:SlyX protein
MPHNASLNSTGPVTSDAPRPQEGTMEDRITELEIKAALQDDLLDELNRVVARQQQQLEWLAQEFRRLQDQLRSQEAQGGKLPSLRDELPPHY